MSFLDDILENEPSLAQSTVNDDPIAYELIANAAREGSVATLRAALARGQVTSSAPLSLVIEIIGIAGNQFDAASGMQGRGGKDSQSIAQRIDFLREWVEATTPPEPQARQERLDLLLQACFSSIFKFHDAAAAQLLKMGANPLAAQIPSKNQKTQNKPDTPAVAADPADSAGPGRQLAIIGTAGRDKAMPMTAALWELMLEHARSQVKKSDTLISGGAAWSDHVAVAMFLEGRVKALTLHLPAPIDAGRFIGPDKSAASAANYYHGIFKQTTGVDGLKEVQQAMQGGAKVTIEPAAAGYGAMFTRNAKVAKDADSVLAYTFGQGNEPADGGTKNTWDQIKGDRIHVPLNDIRQHIKNGQNGQNSHPAPPQEVKEAQSQATTQPGGDYEALAFARLGMRQTAGTTLASAMYGKSAITAQMIDSLPTEGIPIVARLGRIQGPKGAGEDIEIEVNACAYAIAIAEPRQLDQVLASLTDSGLQSDAAYAAVQSGLVQAVRQVTKLRLHDFGADEVHHGIAKILARITDPLKAFANDASSLAQLNVIVTDAPSLKFFDAEGVIIDGEKPFVGESQSKAKKVTLAVALLSAPRAEDAIGALRCLKTLGWNVNEVGSFALDGSSGGATLAHYAAMRGDVEIIASLRAAGVDFMAKDAMERTPAHYAFVGLNRDAAAFIDPVQAEQLQQRYPKAVANVQKMPVQPGVSPADRAPAGSQNPVDESDPWLSGATGVSGVQAHSKEDTQKVTGSGVSGASNVRDVDDINDLLAEAGAENNPGERYESEFDSFEDVGLAAKPVVLANQPKARDEQDPITKAGAMFAIFRERQQKARDALGKPLGLVAAADDAEQVPHAIKAAPSAKPGSAAAKFKRL